MAPWRACRRLGEWRLRGAAMWRLEVKSDPAAPAQIRALVADEDDAVRSLYAMLLRAIDGVSSVLEAEHGADAVRSAREYRIDVAVLDLNMPGLDCVDAALELCAMQPWMGIALQSSDPDVLRQRAVGLSHNQHRVVGPRAISRRPPRAGCLWPRTA